MRAVPVIVACGALLFACAAEEPSISTTDQQVTANNRIALNRIALNRIALNRIALNRIALNRIALNRIALNRIALNAIPSQDLLATADGREVLTYLVGCALPSDVTLVATVGSDTFEFPGLIGLAPNWLSHSLTNKEQSWISACMIARVNNFGDSLLISLRGEHSALTVSAEEQALYSLEEGAFYGDIFAPADQPLVVIACRGQAQAQGVEAAVFAARACARPNAAGTSQCSTPEVTFSYAGDCGDYSGTHAPRACEEGDDGYYEGCHASSATKKWPKPTYDEAITVYLDPNAVVTHP